MIRPRVPREHFVLELPLLRLEAAPGKIAGEYRAVLKGSRTFYVQVPANAADISASIDGQAIIRPQQNPVALSLTFEKGQKIRFEVSWMP
jgi:hypothetical protein